MLYWYIYWEIVADLKGLGNKAVVDKREFTERIILKVVCHLNTIAKGLQLLQQSHSCCTSFYLRLTDNKSHLYHYPYNPR